MIADPLTEPDATSLCVCELTDTFTQSAPTISHHLKGLRDAGLVTSERRGVDAVRPIRDEIRKRVEGPLASLLPA
ncbi:ArsR family transcriptional regulator [Paractinoplanes rishiriensis]|uniref:HTH arsR-type domain-containing protein n=1 Tax=Paractinoplanes rishiriensis TaxID=1050105 RepID=A0A919N2K9_9ACTN|nr:hypothetical protein Ari01nite_81370 [Actinoplanes rishiriensis]